MNDNGEIRLNSTELGCLTMCANGATDMEIASKLSLSELTIGIIFECALRKLPATNRVHALSMALKLELISLKDLK